ncbi:hypothetical protein [Streptomyces gobiensis]|uniref:hypothetical protein n=1 Tax=Streptomyces gobiensis TaxID=2875706 RepID=UPI001E398BF1|nr:hypothetical protein [Streptomyces gobiensis]UGY93218.1 hypothetical protein test1122_16850 [Streptomyces gobiensis]
MSSPDPHNSPYGPPHTSQQPPQGGYPAYPQEQYGGYPGAPGTAPEMPGTLKAARTLLFVLGGISALLAVLLLITAAAITTEDLKDLNGLDDLATARVAIVVVAVILGALAALQIITAALFGRGRGGVRISSIITGALVILLGLLFLVGVPLIGLVFVTCGILVIVFCSKQDAGHWFNHPPSSVG